MRHSLVPVVIATLACASTAAAQIISTSSPSELAGFRALVLTPAGAFPEMVSPHRRADQPYRGTLALRYGQYNYRQARGTFHSVGLSGLVGVKRWLHVGATFGRHSSTSIDEVSYMGSVDVDASLYHKTADNTGNGDTDVGLQLSAGYAKPESGDASARSVWASVPIAITLPQGSSLLTLFVAPSAGYGSLESAGVTDGSLRPMFGAGLCWALKSGFAAHATLHRIVSNESPNQLGFALSYTFGGTRRASE
jgi:hypothetical protein